MRNKKLIAMLAVLVAVLALALPALAADDLVFKFDSAESFKGWSTQGFKTNSSNFANGYFVGYALQKGSTAGLADPGFNSPTLNIKAEDYRYVVIDAYWMLDASWGNSMTCFFLLDGMSALDQTHAVSSSAQPVPNSPGFVKVAIDMTKNELWKGNIRQIRFDPFEMPGTIYVKSITFTNTLPEEEKKEEEVKPADDEKKEEEAPKKQVGVFEKPRTYANNFTDVPAEEWYAPEIAKAYELGLINGETETLFAPEANMTVAEAITLAARTRNNYGTADYDFTVKDGDEWFQPYVDFCVETGIIKAASFDEYDRPATRAEMAFIFSNALPAAEYAAVNSVASVPDVPQTNPYYANILKLYNAGIVMGNDGIGTFSPDNNIIRAEAAAILNRVCNKDSRLKKNIEVAHDVVTPFTMSSEAKFLIENFGFYNTQTGGVPSGWDMRSTLTTPKKDGVMSYLCVDDSPEQEAYFYRKLNHTTDGILDFELGASISSFNGAYIEFTNEKREPVVSLKLNMSSYQNLGPDGQYTDTGARYTTNAPHIRMILNMDARTYDLGMDGAYIGTFPMASADKSIDALYFGVAKEAWMTITANYCFLNHNMLSLERFVNAPNNILPFDIKTIHDGGVVTKEIYDNEIGHGGAAVLNSNANGKTGIAKKFAATSGNIVFESYIYMPEVVDGAKIALKSGDTDAFFLTTKGGNFLAPNGATVKYVTKNLWHIVRFEADTATGKALVKINGKAVGTFDFANKVDTIDSYEITYTPATAAKMYVDEIMAFAATEFADYVPEPVRPEGDEDYLIGMNVCSLWRNGVRHGSWDMISQYPEIEPVLGYYDEGSPEVADWEIKFMAEHGIDYQMFCWYPSSDVNKPIFRTSNSYALIDGYMNAKYSDKLNFAIMWENTAVNCKSMEAWKEYMVPYIIEYFFKDPRYQLVNNKPLFGVWSSDAVGKAFGGTHYKEAFDYLEKKAIEAGFAGVEFMIYNCGAGDLTKTAKALSDNGFDSVGVYHFGSAGANLEKQLASIDALNAVTDIKTMLAVSVGFDDVGWGYGTVRNGLLDPKDYPTVANHVKELLAKRNPSDPYSKMVMISTWNEYGEGTYVSPTKRYGFGYLDAVRAAFTKGGAHTDVVPEGAAKARINYLYDQDRGWIAQQNLNKSDEPEVDPYAGAEVIQSFTFDNAEEAGAWKDYGGQINWQFDEDNKKIVWTTTSKDPCAMRVFDNISTSTCNGIHIRARINSEQTGGGIEIFFSNGGNDSSKYAQAKSGFASLVPNEWHDYYIDFRKNKEWAAIGKINAIRFDPCPYAPESVEVECIEFVMLPEIVEEIPFTVDINGKKIGFAKEPDTSNGGLMCPVNPQTGVPASMRPNDAYGILARMKSDYTWDKKNQVMTIWNNEHTIVFTIGKNTAVADGKTVSLYATPYMYDGIPVLPLDIMCESLGYAVVKHEDGNGVSIMLGDASDYDVIKNRKPGMYEFNLEGDTEDWTLQQLSSLESVNGALHGVASGRDPAVTSPAMSLDASMYESITVRIKFEHDNPKSDSMTIYFKTSTGGLSEARTVRIDIPNSTNGEYVEYTFKMNEHLQWDGKITGIRFDPFNALGTFDIDYIHFNTVPGAEEAIAMKELYDKGKTDTFLNGDAEIPGFVPASGSNVSIVEGDIGHVYLVSAQSAYNYFWYPMKFVPGATYHIEFDAKMVGNVAADAKTSIHVNLMHNEGEKSGVNTFTGVGTLTPDNMNHFSVDLTVPSACDGTGDMFGIYCNPIDGAGVSYWLDNVSFEKVK